MSAGNPRLGANNFDLLRLVFATIVCVVHFCELSGYQELFFLKGYLSSKMAVDAFFVISGFLVFMSHERSSSLLSYSEKRLRRIYPAYFTIIMTCAALLSLVSSLSFSQYFLSAGFWRYVLSNLVFMNFLAPALPGVFEGNIMSAVNGALWTIKIEVAFYFMVPVLALLMKKLKPAFVLAAIYVLSFLYAWLMLYLAVQTGKGYYVELAKQLPGQLCYFIMGVGLYYYLDFFERHVAWFVSAAVLALSVGWLWPVGFLEPAALGVLVIFFGLFFFVGNFGRYGDFSYGVYIVHFPVIQLYLHFGLFSSQPWLQLALVLGTVGVGGVLMWHLCEKRFLRRESHYREAAKPA